MFGNHFMPCEVFNIGGLRQGKEADQQDSKGDHKAGDRPRNPDIKKLFGSADPLFNADDGTKGPDSKRYRNKVGRSEEHTSELQSRGQLVCRLLLEKKSNDKNTSEILRI